MEFIRNILGMQSTRFLRRLKASSARARNTQAGLDAALKWMHASAGDDGVPASGYTMILEDYLPPSVEVSAGWLRLLLFLKRVQPDLYVRHQGPGAAESIARWLVQTQRGDGTWPAGTKDLENDAPGVFAGGLAAFALLEHAEESGYPEAAKPVGRFAQWLMQVQGEDGAWKHYTFDDPAACTIAAWTLILAGDRLQIAGAREAGERNMSFMTALLSNAPRDGLPLPASSYCWMIHAMLNAGHMLRHKEYLRFARQGIAPLQQVMQASGSISAMLHLGKPRVSSYASMYANCLFAQLAFRLYDYTGDAQYQEAANKALSFVQMKQVKSGDKRIDGGVTGSWPVSGSYKPYSIPGESVSSFAWALLLSMQKGRNSVNKEQETGTAS